MFVIACKWTEKSLVLDCVNSITKTHPEEKIVVVDSNSDNKDYFKELPKNVLIADIGNNNYLEGALWYCYENYPDEEFFYLVQDSMILVGDVSDFKNKNVTTLSYFPYEYNPSTYGPSAMRNFCYEQITKNTSYSFLEPRWALFGSTLYIKRSVLDILKSKGFNKILPTNKMESEAMERLWSMVLEQEGYKMTEIGIRVNTQFFTNPYFVKHWLGRQ